MMNITYGVTEEIYSLGHSYRTSYGIAAYADSEVDGTAIIVASVHNITSDRSALAELVTLLQSLGTFHYSSERCGGRFPS